MAFNWLDVVILALLAISLILGLIKGLLRQVIGIAAVIVGFLLAARYYLPVSRTVGRFVSAGKWAELVSFLLLFIAVLLAGWLLAFLLSKIIHGPLKFFDHLLGGGLGLLKGILLCGVIVFALLVFPVDKKGLLESRLAPYCYWITKGFVQVIPTELKVKFKEAYEEITGKRRVHGKEI